MDRSYHHIGHSLLLQTTKALTKFVREHGGVQLPVLNQILAALEGDDFAGASKIFRQIHFGAYGFGDWFPPVVFPNEDSDYVQTVLSRWWNDGPG